MTHETLCVLWFFLLGLLLTEYAVLDGFDLGVGIMHPILGRSDDERRVILNSFGPIWDGNEVWLVTFGGALFAMFPNAYAAIFSGFYSAFMLLLLARIFRAVSIEFRSKLAHGRWRTFWDWAFCGGSLLTVFLFGVAVGNLYLGLELTADGDMAGGLLRVGNDHYDCRIYTPSGQLSLPIGCKHVSGSAKGPRP